MSLTDIKLTHTAELFQKDIFFQEGICSSFFFYILSKIGISCILQR